MKRSTKTAPKAPPLYACIRNAPDLYTRLLVVPKCHALRDKFSEVHMAAGPMNRKSKTSLFMEGQSTGYALRSELIGCRTPPEMLDAPGKISDALPRKSKSVALGSVLLQIRHASRGESWCPGFGLPGAMWERAGYGR